MTTILRSLLKGATLGALAFSLATGSAFAGHGSSGGGKLFGGGSSGGGKHHGGGGSSGGGYVGGGSSGGSY